MKHSQMILAGTLLMVLWVVVPGIVLAEPSKGSTRGHKDYGQKGYSMGHGTDRSMGQHGADHKMHLYSENWRHTLTDKQKMKADQMHVEVKKKMAPLEAQKSFKEAELKALVTQDDPDISAINQKIDEILEVKREIMQKKNAHIVEMRDMLTPEQRLSFDMKLLTQKKHKK